MAANRLYATLVLMGAGLTGATGIAVVAATSLPACSTHANMNHIDAGQVIIDIDMYATIDFAVLPVIDMGFPFIDAGTID